MFHIHRRGFLASLGLSGLGWMTPLGTALARDAEKKSSLPPKSMILLWLDGGPSQLDTFDPKPGAKIGGDVKGVSTNIPGVQLASGLERLAEQLDKVTLLRSLVGQEGDHERGAYHLKSGHRMDPTVVHPSLGAIICHAHPEDTLDIPRHISILSGAWPARGGFLGADYDAFKIYDPAEKVPNITPHVDTKRFDKRLEDLAVVEGAFAQGRKHRPGIADTTGPLDRARKLMSSAQLAAFDIKKEPLALQEAYGQNSFGRGCLAARRLIEAGVRCVEVSLTGWDSHANNETICTNRLKELDPAFSTLLKDLSDRKLLDRTLVVCMGEFGRTPIINPLAGRDHWPHGFSAILAGCGFRSGYVHGETDPEGGKQTKDPVTVEDLHATLLKSLGIDHEKTLKTPIRRTVRRSDGEPVAALLR
jgi:hypothetical protein